MEKTEQVQLSREITSQLDNLLGKVNFEEAINEPEGYQELPDGYYLGCVEKAELTVSKSSNQPMVALTFKVVEDGQKTDCDANGEIFYSEAKGSKNRKIFMYFVLKDENSVSRFARDMVKFEDENGQPLLDIQCFTSSDLLMDALDILQSIKPQLYIQLSTTVKDEKVSTWKNLISWTRAEVLELPL